MKRGISFCVVLVIVVVAGTSWAQQAEKIQEKQQPSPRYKEKTVYDFEDDLIEGELMRPDGEYINVRPNFEYSSLIKIRKDFIDELLKSAEDM